MSNHFDIRRVGIAYIIILEYKLHRLHKSSTPELYLFGNAICTRVWIVSQDVGVNGFPGVNAICTRVWIVRNGAEQSGNRHGTQFVRGYELWDGCKPAEARRPKTQFVRGYELWERLIIMDTAHLQRNLYAGMNCERAPTRHNPHAAATQFVRGYELWDVANDLKPGKE